MAHIHDVVDTDVPLRIDSGTRKIINHSDNTDKKRIMQGDHNCEILTFQLDRHIDGHDMTLCNLVRIHYVNIGEGGQRNEGVEYVNNLDVSEADNKIVEFTWQISGNVTKLVGPVNFCVEFTCVSDGFVVYTWKTAICNHLVIEQSIDNSDIVGPDYIISVDSIPYTLDDQAKLNGMYDDVEAIKADLGDIKSDISDINGSVGDISTALDAIIALQGQY